MLGERKIMISLTNQITSVCPNLCVTVLVILQLNLSTTPLDFRRSFWPTSWIALRHERSVGSISVASIGHAGHRPISACFTPQHRGRKIRSRAAKTVTFYDSFCRIPGRRGPSSSFETKLASGACGVESPTPSIHARMTIARKTTARKTTASEDVSELCVPVQRAETCTEVVAAHHVPGKLMLVDSEALPLQECT